MSKNSTYYEHANGTRYSLCKRCYNLIVHSPFGYVEFKVSASVDTYRYLLYYAEENDLPRATEDRLVWGVIKHMGYCFLDQLLRREEKDRLEAVTFIRRAKLDDILNPVIYIKVVDFKPCPFDIDDVSIEKVEIPE